MLLEFLKAHLRQISIAHKVRDMLMPRRTCDVRIIRGLPSFATPSTTSLEFRAQLAMQSAERVFPSMLELIRCQGHIPMEVTSIEQFTSGNFQPKCALSLKQLFDHYGSDKSTSNNYHLVYGRLLDRADEFRSILEIGLGSNNEDVPSTMGRFGRPGASLRAFRDFCPNAHIYGADLDRRILFAEDRITTFYVDQTDLSSINNLSAALPRDLDLIIDDGLHSPDANIAVLLLGIKNLRVGGWLVIEDISRHSGPIWQCLAHLLRSDFRVSLLKTRQALLFVGQRL